MRKCYKLVIYEVSSHQQATYQCFILASQNSNVNFQDQVETINLHLSSIVRNKSLFQFVSTCIPLPVILNVLDIFFNRW